MDEKQFKLIIHQIAEQSISETRDPLPVIKARILAEHKGKEKNHLFRLQPTQVIALMGIFIVVVFLVTPSGRALAQEIIQFFSRSEGDTMPLSQQQATALANIPTPQPTYLMLLSTVVPDSSSPMTDLDKAAAQAPGCSEQYQTYLCQAAAVELKVGYDLKGFSAIPPGYIFSKFDIQAQETVVMTIYKSVEGEGWLVLYQGKGAVPKFIKNSNFEKAPADKIETVKIGSSQGEYVRGMFAIKAGASDMTWMDNGWIQKIGWQAGDRWFLLEENNSPIALSYMNKEQLLEVAGSLVDLQNSAIPTPNPQHLNTISQVEELAGFTVMEPDILPEDFKLDHARYEPEWKSVLLFYQGKSGVLIIKQTDNKDYILRDLASVYPHVSEVNVRNETGIYANHQDNPRPVQWVEEGENVLFWKEGDRAMQIIYRPNNIYGGQIGKSELVAIGNSLK